MIDRVIELRRLSITGEVEFNENPFVVIAANNSIGVLPNLDVFRKLLPQSRYDYLYLYDDCDYIVNGISDWVVNSPITQSELINGQRYIDDNSGFSVEDRCILMRELLWGALKKEEIERVKESLMFFIVRRYVEQESKR